MGKLSSLAGDTVIYGVSTILGRLLNWLLMPFYIRCIPQNEYGSVVVVYSIIAVLLVVVTLGFETGYFRFVTDENKNKLLDTLSSGVFFFGAFLIVLFYFFRDFFCDLFEFASTDFLFYASLIVLVDAFNAIYFAQLRYERKSVLYSILRLVQVLITIIFNIFFLVFLNKHTFFGFDFSSFNNVSYILIANLIGSLSSTIYFIPRIFKHKEIDFQLFKRVLLYSFPLVGMGFFGVANQNIEKFLLLKLDFHEDVYSQIAIYGANYKIGILMAIFTQSFRLAFEPFFFRENSTSSKRDVYADVMKYFVYFGLIIFAGVVLFIPIVNLLLKEEYFEGNVVIPVILISQLFFGVYYSLSMWYKAVDKTYFGVIMSLVGLAVNVISNIILIPHFGYLGAAFSTLIGYFTMMVLSLYLGNKYYPINYPLLKLSVVSLVVCCFVMSVSYLNNNFFGGFWFLSSLFSLIFILLFFIKIENIDPKSLLKYVRKQG